MKGGRRLVLEYALEEDLRYRIIKCSTLHDDQGSETVTYVIETHAYDELGGDIWLRTAVSGEIPNWMHALLVHLAKEKE